MDTSEVLSSFVATSFDRFDIFLALNGWKVGTIQAVRWDRMNEGGLILPYEDIYLSSNQAELYVYGRSFEEPFRRMFQLIIPGMNFVNSKLLAFEQSAYTTSVASLKWDEIPFKEYR